MAEEAKEYGYLKTINKASYAELTPEQRAEQRVQPGLCEAHGGHAVTRPSIWPPRLRSASKKGKEYAAVRCVQCGATVIIYDPLQDGVRWADAPKPEAAKK